MSRILVVEPRHSGHLLVYVRLLLAEISDRGLQPVLATGAGVKGSSEYSANLSDYNGEADEFDLPLTLRKLEELATRHSADLVVVPHGDEVVGSAALRGYRGPGALSLLIMRDPLWEIPSSRRRWPRLRLKQALMFVAARRRNISLVRLRELGYAGRQKHVVDPFIPDGTLSDISQGAQELRSTLALGQDTTWVAVTGAITDRKNVPLILEALADVRRQQPIRPVGLMLIGPLRLSPPWGVELIEAKAQAHGIPVVIDDRVLTNYEMNCVVAAADIVLMAYSTHSPNSTMVKAYALGTRLVVAGPVSVQGFARALGFTSVSELSVAGLSKSIRDALGSVRPENHFEVATGRDFASGLLDSPRRTQGKVQPNAYDR